MTRLTLALLCGCLVLPAWAQTARPDRPGSITGRVIRPDGLPQPDAEVVAATRGRDGQLHLSPWRAHTAFDGQYAITGVPAGRYLVLVRVVGADAPVEGRPHATLFPGVPTTEAGTAVDVFAGVPRFEAAGTVGEHELIVQGLPQGWVVRATPVLWLDAAETITDVRVEIGQIANRR